MFLKVGHNISYIVVLWRNTQIFDPRSYKVVRGQKVKISLMWYCFAPVSLMFTKYGLVHRLLKGFQLGVKMKVKGHPTVIWGHTCKYFEMLFSPTWITKLSSKLLRRTTGMCRLQITSPIWDEEYFWYLSNQFCATPPFYQSHKISLLTKSVYCLLFFIVHSL